MEGTMKKTASVSVCFFAMTVMFCLQAISADKEQICSNYADTAVQQYNFGQQHNLPGIVPPVWSNDRNGHYNWCMHGENYRFANNENAKRQAYLDKKIIKTPPKQQSGSGGAVMGTGVILPDIVRTSVSTAGDNSYLGCFRDLKDRDLSGYTFNSPQMTKKLCMETCRKKGFGYAGLQYSQYCFCGNSYGRLGKADNCNMACAGNSKETCGGGWANSVYRVKSGESNNVAIAAGLNPANQMMKSVQHFNQLKKISNTPDPIVPIFMHTLEKLNSGSSSFSEIELAMLAGIKVLSPVQRKKLMDRWNQIPLNVRMAATPTTIRNLTPTSIVSMPMFTGALVEAAKTIEIKNTQNNTPQQPHALPDIAALQNAGLVANAPRITGFSPLGPDGPSVRVGEKFVLSGNNFGDNPAKTWIHFLRYKKGKYVLVASIHPQQINNNKITSTIIAPDIYDRYYTKATRVIVEVDKKFSSPISVVIGASLQPTPMITRVEPLTVYPGGNILVTGKNFNRPLNLFMNTLNKKASAYRSAGFYFNATPTVLNDKQFQFTIPQDAWSGYYRFNVRSGNSGYSDFSLFQILPTNYKVKFTHLKCIDESSELSASDELVVAWVIIADDSAWAKGSSEFSNVDKGETKNFSETDGLIIPASGGWQPVRDFIYFRTTLYEWDQGDIDSYNSAIKSVGEVAPAVGTAIGAIFGSPEAGKKAGEIIQVIGDGLTKLISWLGGGDPDFMGSYSKTYTAPELQNLTSSKPIFSDEIPFFNDDATGSDILYFNITRNYSIER